MMPMPSFFGGRRRMRGASVPESLGVNPLQPVAQKPDIPTGEVRSRRSFMGGPSTLAVLGATLRQMDGGNELDEYLSGQQDQQYQRDMFGLRAAQGRREDEEAQTERHSLAQRQQVAEEYIRSLPVDQQMRARVAYTADPEAFAEAIAELSDDGLTSEEETEQVQRRYRFTDSTDIAVAAASRLAVAAHDSGDTTLARESVVLTAEVAEFVGARASLVDGGVPRRRRIERRADRNQPRSSLATRGEQGFLRRAAR
jgi:hypothetical protein